jgi:hypothetical protein
MRNKPTESELAQMCGASESTEMPLEDRVIHMHFFREGRDWYLTEYDSFRRTFFGLFVPDKDYRNARWGHFSLDELERGGTLTGQEVVRNLDWTPKRAFEVDRIRDACGWTQHRPCSADGGDFSYPSQPE